MTLRLTLIATITLLLFLWLIGGPEQPLETQMVAASVEWRSRTPAITGAVIALTHLGSGLFLLTLTAAAAALLFRRRHREALFLLAATLSGRLMVELIKWLTDRARPELDPHPVYVASLSFPSGHAANSMITYLALALFAAPPRWRRSAVVAAVLLSLAIGATRPLLGVHWPSDVLAGWVLGIVWVGLWSARYRVSRSA